MKNIFFTGITFLSLFISINQGNPAFGATFICGDTCYDIKTTKGTFNDLKNQLMRTPWWGDSDLAKNIATKVGTKLGTPNPGIFEGGKSGPRFVFGNEGTVVNRTVQTWTYLPDAPIPNPPTFISRLSTIPTNESVWAIGKEVEECPESSNIIGLGAFVLLGLAFKYKKTAND